MKRPKVHWIWSVKTSSDTRRPKPPTTSKCCSACAVSVICLKRFILVKRIWRRGCRSVLYCIVGRGIQNNETIKISHDVTPRIHECKSSGKGSKVAQCVSVLISEPIVSEGITEAVLVFCKRPIEVDVAVFSYLDIGYSVVELTPDMLRDVESHWFYPGRTASRDSGSFLALWKYKFCYL